MLVSEESASYLGHRNSNMRRHGVPLGIRRPTEVLFVGVLAVDATRPSTMRGGVGIEARTSPTLTVQQLPYKDVFKRCAPRRTGWCLPATMHVGPSRRVLKRERRTNKSGRAV